MLVWARVNFFLLASTPTRESGLQLRSEEAGTYLPTYPLSNPSILVDSNRFPDGSVRRVTDLHTEDLQFNSRAERHEKRRVLSENVVPK